MKKSLIALAVLAASGAAMAQSSVTVYGIADVWVGSVKMDGAKAETQMVDGGVSPSRIGFKGTEDLGGGLKANFVLEQGFDLTSGAQAAEGKAFSRETSVGFSGDFGAVKLGRFTTAYDDVQGATQSGFDSALTAANYLFASSLLYTSRPNQGIGYYSPKFGGFSAAVTFSRVNGNTVDLADFDLGAGVLAADVDTRNTAFNVQYEAGPFYAGLAYQKDQYGDATDNLKVTFTRLSGSYDLGVAKLLANYGRSKATLAGAGSATVTDYSIGADIPVSSNATVSVGYAHAKVKGGESNDGWNVVGAYSLSKRTTVYGGYVTTDLVGGLDRALAVGIKHTF